MNRSILYLTLSAMMINCSDMGTNPQPNIIVNTEKISYTSTEPIVVSLKNVGSATAYFATCNYQIGFFIERKENGVWADAGSVAIVCLAIYASPNKPLEPGGLTTDTFNESVAGVYRLKFPYNSQNTGSMIQSAASNEFVVR